MCAGFDMVQEEDFTPSIEEFLPMIYQAKAKAINENKKFDIYLHAGESNSRHNTQLYDAILVGTKRIGHGFHVVYTPTLIEEIKKRDICIECCPVSNFVLGYSLDLRNHPVRGLLQAGCPVAISPDDPGFMSYDGVTLDYVYAFLCWDLNLADLK